VPGNNSRSELILRKVQKIVIILLLQLFCIGQNIIAQDTASVAARSQREFKAEPMKATMLAVAFPGMGQIYNRKFWKIPLVYAGFGAVIYSVGFNTSNHNKFMKAYQDFTDKIPDTDSYAEMITWADPAEYDPVKYPETHNPSTASWVKDRLLTGVDYYKRYRDLSYIGIAAWYLISVLDANVDASLFNYDISNNLDLDVAPLQLPVPGFAGAGLNITLKLSF